MVVVLEVVAVRAYRRYRASRQDPLGRPCAKPVVEGLHEAQGYLACAEGSLGRCLEAAQASGAEGEQLLIEGMREGLGLQKGLIRELCEGAGVAAGPTCMTACSGARADEAGLRPLAEEMGLYGRQAAIWAFDTAPEMAGMAKRCRCRAAAKALRIAGEVESCHAEIAEAIVAGECDERHEVSLCPSCGYIVFGRRPAFCTACGQPGFEMRALRRGLLD